MAKINLGTLVFFLVMHFVVLILYAIFKATLVQIEAEKSVTENFVREKENGQIKGLISNMWLILCYTVQLVITKLCTKFQDPRSSSS